MLFSDPQTNFAVGLGVFLSVGSVVQGHWFSSFIYLVATGGVIIFHDKQLWNRVVHLPSLEEKEEEEEEEPEDEDKSASITISVDISDADNWLGQALLDHLTNHRETRHIAFQRRAFVLNQTEVIRLDTDIYAVQKSPLPELGSSSCSPVGNSKTGPDTQVIEVFSHHKTAIQLRDWLDHLKAHYIASFKNKLGKTRYFFQMMPSTAPLTMEGKKDLTRLPNQFSFIMKPFHTNRSFGNLFGEEIDLIRERVRFFQTRRDWYDDKGIPYTLGILLSGPPGTGKTSTIKCLANESNRHIFSVAMGSDMTRVQLENLFYNENVVVVVDGQTQTVCIPLDQRLYVLEDADAQQGSMLLRRKEKPVAKRVSEATVRPRFELEDAGEHLKVDLSFLLNLLDGALENPGRLLVMTSNHPEKLDEALVRPGRIDVVAQFKTCSLATLRKMVEFFYETPLETRHIQALQEVVSDAVKGLPEAATKVGLTEAATKVGLPEAATKVGLPEAAVKGLTPAQVYRLLFQHFGDVDAAIDAMRAEVGLSAAEEKPLSTEEEWQDTRAELDKVVEEIRSNLQQKSNYSEEETRMENKVVEEVRKNLREQFQHVPDPVSYSWESNFTQLCGHDNNSWESQYQRP